MLTPEQNDALIHQLIDALRGMLDASELVTVHEDAQAALQAARDAGYTQMEG